MGFFNFLNKKSDNESAATVSLPVVEPSEAKEEVESVAPVKAEDSNVNKPLTVSYATGWPIDVIYGYLHKNLRIRALLMLWSRVIWLSVI